MGRSARPRNIVLQDITIYCYVSKDITIELLSVEGYYLRLLRCRRILPLTVECRRLRNWVILYYFTNVHLHGQFSDQFVIVDLDPMYVYAPDCRSRSYVRIRPRLSISMLCTYTPQIVDLDPMYVYSPDCRSRSNVRIRPRLSISIQCTYTPQIFTTKYFRPENNPNISEFFSVF